MKRWGKEDTELSFRLINIGLQKHKIKCLAVCYHLYHPILSKEGLNINNTILADTISENKISQRILKENHSAFRVFNVNHRPPTFRVALLRRHPE